MRILVCSLKKGARVLDVGAARKSILGILGYSVVSLDLAPQKGVDIVADASALPFRDNAFNTVTLVDVIEHIPRAYREK